MAFKSTQQTLHCSQLNQGSCEQVFPLLCPVREADWIDGWKYELLHSESGYAEQDCVFVTPNGDNQKTIWQITQYDPKNFRLEFIRLTPNENIVKINIELEPISDNQSKSHISYQYTGLSEEQNHYIETELPDVFSGYMQYWENAINFYLKTGNVLPK